MPDVELDDLPDSSHLSNVFEVQAVAGVALQAVPGGCGCGLVQPFPFGITCLRGRSGVTPGMQFHHRSTKLRTNLLRLRLTP